MSYNFKYFDNFSSITILSVGSANVQYKAKYPIKIASNKKIGSNVTFKNLLLIMLTHKILLHNGKNIKIPLNRIPKKIK